MSVKHIMHHNMSVLMENQMNESKNEMRFESRVNSGL